MWCARKTTSSPLEKKSIPLAQLIQTLTERELVAGIHVANDSFTGIAFQPLDQLSSIQINCTGQTVFETSQSLCLLLFLQIQVGQLFQRQQKTPEIRAVGNDFDFEIAHIKTLETRWNAGQFTNTQRAILNHRTLSHVVKNAHCSAS